ncbi:endopeptidase La [Candidatus Dependentiae bacterium]
MKNEEKEREKEAIPCTLPVIPTVDVVVFPQMVVPLLVLDEKIIGGVSRAAENDKNVLIVATKDQPVGYDGPIGTQDLFSVGTIGRVLRAMTLSDGSIKVLVQGISRAKIKNITTEGDELQSEVEEVIFNVCEDREEEVEIKMREMLAYVEQVGERVRDYGRDFQVVMSQIQDPERLVDFVISHMGVSVKHSQILLEKNNILDLLDGVFELFRNEVELASVQEDVKVTARDSIDRSQREYFLKEQLRAIQKELGESSDSENDDLKEKLRTLPLSDEAREEAERQLRRLEHTSQDSLEATVIRNHLEWLFGMPWGVKTEDICEIKHAQTILDEDHFGLEKVKDRILDYLSVRMFQNEYHAPLLCLTGPPGVGKTSLGKSVARCLGRKFVRISLGGVHDESEIRGHRRTYVGALPGRVVQSMRKAGSMNPVLMIDEVDKLGQSNRGDPAAALLEVLDPEQNSTFYDNYLGVPFDLSHVMFIATSNDASSIPPALRDRMEVIDLSGYSKQEKVQIATGHLVGKAIKNAGLEEKGIEFSDELIGDIISSYTREAGVRELERFIRRICAKFARSLVEKGEKVTFTHDNLQQYLGPRRIRCEKGTGERKIGVCNGLAWTPYGGQVLQVEAVLMPGHGKLILTGQLGDVMKESAQAALSYIRSHADRFKIDVNAFEDFDLHIHLPAGAIPKDGPSAGITLLASVLSVFTKRPLDGTFAMTGEVDLQGTMLPIGGLKEKVLAAKQYGVKTVILPKENECDAQDALKYAEGLDLMFVENVEQALDRILLPVEKF